MIPGCNHQNHRKRLDCSPVVTGFDKSIFDNGKSPELEDVENQPAGE